MGWKEIWARKGQAAGKLASLSDLIVADGFDSGLGKIEPRHWTKMVMNAAERLNLRTHERICEVGCGAGAFLYPLYCSGFLDLSGLDYSAPHIGQARRMIPSGNFVVGEAAHLPFRTGFFDAGICNGVFLYFPSLEYADAAVRELARSLRDGGRSLILDVNDASRRRDFETRRRDALGADEYDRLYRDAPQLFIERQWWCLNSDRWGVELEIYDQRVEGYGNSEFRYNVLLRRKSGCESPSAVLPKGRGGSVSDA